MKNGMRCCLEDLKETWDNHPVAFTVWWTITTTLFMCGRFIAQALIN